VTVSLCDCVVDHQEQVEAFRFNNDTLSQIVRIVSFHAGNLLLENALYVVINPREMCTFGGAENDGHENDGPSELQGMKLQNMTEKYTQNSLFVDSIDFAVGLYRLACCGNDSTL